MIWLASYPRSGNKLVQQALHHVFGQKVRSIYKVPEGEHEIAPTWDRNESDDVYVKTHHLPWYDKNPAIYIVRDPRDVVCSYARYLSRTNHAFKGNSFSSIAEWVIHSEEYGGWSVNCQEWLKLATVVIRFEECVLDPVGVVQDAIIAVKKHKPTRQGEMPKFSDLQRGADWYFQTGKAGRWESELSTELAEMCVTKNESMMQRLGYLSPLVSANS